MSRRGIVHDGRITDSYYTLPVRRRGSQGPPRQPTSEATQCLVLGFPELLLILVIVIVIFGAGKLPQLGKGLGEGISNFRDGLKGRDEKKAATLEEKKNA